jgi:uncharacterized RDD family membrane protein YckC
MRLGGTARGFLILVAIAVAITALKLELALGIVFLILRIAFIVAIGYFLYSFWRNNRADIAMWARRTRVVFYGGATLALVNIVASVFLPYPEGGLEALVFFAVLVGAGFAMYRAWRDEHTYGY